MLLRAQAFGEEPCIRFAIMKLDDRTLWSGVEFIDDFDAARKYWHPSDACWDMQAILREHYGHLPNRQFVVPVEINVQGDVSEREIAEYLYRASILSLRTEEFGNGPRDSYVAPVIHWGYIKPIDRPVDKSSDNPVVDWGFGLDVQNGDI